MNECWEWQGMKSERGYGRVKIEGKRISAHRIAYMLCYGAFDDNLYVCHRCDNPSCCNPNHLFLATTQENTADKIFKNRQIKGTQVNTSKFTEKDIKIIRELGKQGQSTSTIARQYGVTPKAIRDIVLRLTWKHIP